MFRTLLQRATAAGPAQGLTAHATAALFLHSLLLDCALVACDDAGKPSADPLPAAWIRPASSHFAFTYRSLVWPEGLCLLRCVPLGMCTTRRPTSLSAVEPFAASLLPVYHAFTVSSHIVYARPPSSCSLPPSRGGGCWEGRDSASCRLAALLLGCGMDCGTAAGLLICRVGMIRPL